MLVDACADRAPDAVVRARRIGDLPDRAVPASVVIAVAPLPVAFGGAGHDAWIEDLRRHLGGIVTAMRSRREGRIVVVTHLGPDDGGDPVGADAIAGAAAEGLVQRIARVGGPDGVGANVVRAGIIDHPGVRRSLRRDRERSERVEREVRGSPLRRVVRIDEIAGTVAFLASGDAGYLTGVVLPVDAGLGLGR